jgi:hypothetical protein
MPHFHRLRRTGVTVALVAATAIIAGRALASDHMDTPEVELNPRMDINDVYAFPGATADRITLVMTTSSPLVGTDATFDPNLLYQFKVDLTGDAVEDRVLQLTFEGTGAAQRFELRGPAVPEMTGTRAMLVSSGPVVRGPLNASVNGSNGIQVFAGVRADPFVLDLEQFFSIIPDRRPATGPLSTPLTPTASQFRSPGVDFLRPFNTLAIIVELPKSLLVQSTADVRVGVWGTISR